MSWEAPTQEMARPAPALLESLDVSPAPTDEEAVAIVAAMEALWPKPVVLAGEERPRQGAWRFSGRWWARPVAARRDRPWY
ncbi:MAG: hypothetical protein R2705_06555 [Ilumatobacteraceae bacterium]